MYLYGMTKYHFEDKTQNHDLIVKCIPDIPEHISIDENNNLHINVIHRTNLRDLLEKNQYNLYLL